MKDQSVIWLVLFLAFSSSLRAQDRISTITELLKTPKSYIIHKTQQAIDIDGLPNEQDWKQAEWTGYFTDIEGSLKPEPTYNTRVKMLWDEKNLYIYAKLEEPHIWATLKNKDDIVYHDNDFEVFISNEEFSQEYFELEINAFATIFDLLLGRPYRNGGKAIIDWDIKGLQSAIHIDGTLNNPTDVDNYWAVEIAIPFESISLSGLTKIPKDGNIWRINFSRVQWQREVKNGRYEKLRNKEGKFLSENNWVWSPQGVINMHFPERWGYLQFSTQAPSNNQQLKFTLPEKEKIKQIAWLVYYLQDEYYRENGSYTDKVQELITLYPATKDLINFVTIEINAGQQWYNANVHQPGTDFDYFMNQQGILSKSR